MRRLVCAAVSAVVAAALLAACSSAARGASDRRDSSRNTLAASSSVPSDAVSSGSAASGHVLMPPPGAVPIRGKIDNGYLYLGAGGAGLAAIFGFVGGAQAASGEVVTTSGTGAAWRLHLIPPSLGQPQGFAFVSPSSGWAWTIGADLQPGLHFTTDGARSWHAVATRFYIQTVAVASGTTWFAAATCPTGLRGPCLTKLYVAGRVGAAPLPLVHQPSPGSDNIDSVAVLGTSRVFVLLRSQAGTPRLVRSLDGGRSWSRAALPAACDGPSPSRGLASAPTGELLLACAAPGQNMNPSGPVSMFRSTTDAASWQSLSPSRSGPEAGCCLARLVAPTSRVLWATVQPPAGPAAVYRSSDAGRTWSDVLGDLDTPAANPGDVLAFTATGADDAWALLKADQGGGAVFWIERTTDGGTTWRSSLPPFAAPSVATPRPTK